jgi:hypothetical protein
MSETTHDDHPPADEPGDAGHGDGHGDGHGEHEEHGTALGPIDWRAWGAGLLGVGAGLAVAVCLYASTAL